MSGGTALADASWSGCTDGLSLRINHRKDGAISVRETDRGALGLVPLEDSSGNRRRLGHITKQGSSILRFLLVEAAQVTARSIPEWRNKYVHLTMRRGRKIAKLAMARRLAIALYRMWVDNAGIVIVRDAMFRQRSAIDLVRTYALPANSRFSVDTFTFSPSLIKRGTRISRPVSSRAVLVPPPDDSPRTAGSVSATASSTNIGSSKPIGLPLYLRSAINAPSIRKSNASPTT